VRTYPSPLLSGCLQFLSGVRCNPAGVPVHAHGVARDTHHHADFGVTLDSIAEVKVLLRLRLLGVADGVQGKRYGVLADALSVNRVRAGAERLPPCEHHADCLPSPFATKPRISASFCDASVIV
jgi:hypothetical protein